MCVCIYSGSIEKRIHNKLRQYPEHDTLSIYIYISGFKLVEEYIF